MLTFLMALFKGIAHVALMAGTGWYVVHHGTISINSTSVRTWIFTLILGASLVSRTIRVEHTFRPTYCVWIADQIGRTAAFAIAVVSDVRYCVRSAWVGPTWIYWL